MLCVRCLTFRAHASRARAAGSRARILSRRWRTSSFSDIAQCAGKSRLHLARSWSSKRSQGSPLRGVNESRSRRRVFGERSADLLSLQITRSRIPGYFYWSHVKWMRFEHLVAPSAKCVQHAYAWWFFRRQLGICRTPFGFASYSATLSEEPVAYLERRNVITQHRYYSRNVAECQVERR